MFKLALVVLIIVLIFVVKLVGNTLVNVRKSVHDVIILL